VDPELRFAINKELAQYVAPKLKAVEMTIEGELNGEVRIVSFKDMKPEDMDGVDR
jgi:sensor domain CHASE-containing protein